MECDFIVEETEFDTYVRSLGCLPFQVLCLEICRMTVGETVSAGRIYNRTKSDIVKVIGRQEVGTKLALRGCEFEIGDRCALKKLFFMDIPAN